MTKIPKGEKQLWLNKGGGTFTYKGRTVLSGEYFRADEGDVPVAFRDTLVMVDEPGVVVIEVEEQRFRPQKRSSGWYDVVDNEGNVVSKQALRWHEAEKLAEKKNAE